MYKVQKNHQVIKKFDSNKGITLIALVVTIIVLIILAGITIGTLVSDDGVINKAKFSSFATKIRQYQEKVDNYVIDEEQNSGHENADVYITDSEQIKEILGDIEDGDENKYVIQDNELRYNPDTVTDDEEEWLIELGILAMTAGVLLTFMVNGSVYQTIESHKMKFPEVDPISTEGNFAGWYYDQSTTNQALEGDEVTKNITLYAKFGDFVATFMANGEVYETIEGNSLTFPATNPTKDTVKFVGWYYDEEGTKEAKVGDTLTANTTLYPKWTSYITNKLNGTLIWMEFFIDGYSDKEDNTWHYVQNSQEFDELNIGQYSPNEYPSLVFCGGNGSGEIYQYKGSNKIVKAEITAEKNYSGEYDVSTPCSIDNSGKVTIDGGTNTSTYRVYIEVTFEDGSTDTDMFKIHNQFICLAEGTKITLADMSKKNIEDIEYSDELLVWDFDNGCFAKAKPLWIMKAQVTEEYNLIKFDDGTELKTVIDHRIFNMEKQEFTYTMDEENTPIGTSVFKEDGSVAKIVERKVVKEKVNYYNVITDYHMNLFANGLLTSLRLNNLYKIENMKFVKDDRKLTPKEEFEGIPDKYIKGLRLAEQPKEINRGNDVKHTKTLQEYVKRLLPLEK